MQRSDFHYDFPPELIALYPSKRRSDSRLLRLGRKTGDLAHGHFRELVGLLHPDDLLVFNDAQVIPARLFGRKESGGQVEVLLERIIAEDQALVQLRASKSPLPGTRLFFDDEGATAAAAQVLSQEKGFYLLRFTRPVSELAERLGHIPLPPYIKRQDEALDRERYQTVYGRSKGAVAAPTAGLHFDEALLADIKTRGIATTMVTLHVGAGTFQPLRTENIMAHRMHKEYLEVSETACAQVEACRQRKGRVIAVGTTSVRCLETAGSGGAMRPYRGDTELFIYPGYRFGMVDALLTNFHQPESTLLMLVCAFAGREKTLTAYREAIRKRYRLFSYGDAMFIA